MRQGGQCRCPRTSITFADMDCRFDYSAHSDSVATDPNINPGHLDDNGSEKMAHLVPLAYDTSSMQPNILTGSMRDSVISEQPAGQGQKITGQSHGGVEQRYLHVGDRGDVQSHMDYDPVDVPQG